MRLTVQAGIVGLTRRKREILDRKHAKLQRFMNGDRDVPPYSANKQQALRYYRSMPYYRLTKMIGYKAMLKGIPAVTISEAYTSVTCHICRCEGRRKTQGLFVCPHCGEYNADLNGAINIAKKFERWLGYMPLHGAACESALNQPMLEAPSVRVG